MSELMAIVLTVMGFFATHPFVAALSTIFAFVSSKVLYWELSEGGDPLSERALLITAWIGMNGVALLVICMAYTLVCRCEPDGGQFGVPLLGLVVYAGFRRASRDFHR